MPVTDFKKPTQLLTPCLKSVWRHRAQLPNLRENPKKAIVATLYRRVWSGFDMTRQKKPPEMVKKHQRTGSKKVRPRETNLLFRFRGLTVRRIRLDSLARGELPKKRLVHFR